MTKEDEEQNPFVPLIGNNEQASEDLGIQEFDSEGAEDTCRELNLNVKEENLEQSSRVRVIRRTPRGVLSFINPQNLRQYAYNEDLMHQFAEKCRRMTKRQRRRAMHTGSPISSDDQNGDSPSPYEPPLFESSSVEVGENSEIGSGGNNHSVSDSQPPLLDSIVDAKFNVWETEFTLFFFGAPYCFHSLQFVPVLANFVHEQNERFESHVKENCDIEGEGENLGDKINTRIVPLQCICVPDVMHQPAIQNFCHGTGMYYFNDPADSALSSIRSFFQVSYIPTVIVVSNKTGKVITDWGRTAIEFHPQGAVEAWRNGRSGASYFWSFCTTS